MPRTPRFCLPAVIASCVALIAAAPLPHPSPPKASEAKPQDNDPQPLAVAIPASPLKDRVRKLLLSPYAKATGTELGDPPWDGSLAAAQSLLSAHQADLLLASGAALAAGCRSGAFDRIDWTLLGRDRFLAIAASDCGVGAFLAATVLAWDRDKLPGTPGWADFWDIAKHPGRRGLHRAARGNLEVALLADGVAPADIYRTLRSSDGVDRAFRKLDQLKPYIEWWDQPSQPAQSLAASKVLLTSALFALLPAGPRLHIGVSWSGSLTEVTSWARPSGAPHQAAALAAMTVASDPARQAEFAQAAGLGPATKLGLALLPQAARLQSPSLPANLQDGLAVDEAFWLDNGDKLEARFTAWIGK